jgi:hypothetical protein
MKKGWKVTFISFGTLLLLLVLTAAFLYWKIRSIDLADIQARHVTAVVENGGTENPDPAAAEEPVVPKALTGAVDKAEQLTDKPVKSQDALDVAAILLNSGLSFKEMMELMGKSTETLSTKEKQRIRDMLLQKLKPEEIKALRAITTDYGKGLVILNPDYPIELVGVKDKQQRERIMKELQRKEGSADLEKAGASGELQAEPAKQTAEPDIPEQTSAELLQVKRKYEGELAKIKAVCSRNATAMTEKVVQGIEQTKKNKGSMSGLSQEELLQTIMNTEQNCESSFQKVLDDAKQEFKQKDLPYTAVLQTWRDEYEATKEKIRSTALVRINGSLK